MNVLIRADASKHIGGGHIGRCIAIAEAVKKRGGEASFATRCDAILGHSMLTASGLSFTAIDAAVDWRKDAGATCALLGSIDWVVVDHYGLDYRWEEAVKSAGVRLLALDDRADRPHACDILVDAGRPDGKPSAYSQFVPEDCIQLLGPRYALLRRAFSTRSKRRVRHARPKLMVSFGSADGAQITEPAIAAVQKAGGIGDVEIHVVVTDANPRRDAIRRCDHIVLHENVDDMATLLSDMDLAIGAGGVSLWERCCLGVPGIAISLNDNQSSGVKIAVAAGAAQALDIETAYQPNAFAAAVEALLADRQSWQTMAEAARRLVDGRGAERIAAHIGPLSLRPAQADDCDILWHWANDSAVRAMSFNSSPIPWKDHQAWFAQKINTPDTMIFIASLGDRSVGQVRLDNSADAGGWTVDISVSSEFRGKYFAIEMLLKALAALRQHQLDAPVVAWVKDNNIASLKLFESAGFTRNGSCPGAIQFCYR